MNILTMTATDEGVARERGFYDHAMIPNKYTAFLQKIDASGFDPSVCWAFLGAGKGNGYGNVTVEGEQIGAHRRAYELFCGPIPPGLDVCHTCDNRWCVNPDHLFVDTRQGNMQDCRSKGRAAGGNRKHLKERQVQEIRRLLITGMSQHKIATSLDVSYNTVNSIKRGTSYGSVG